MRYRFTGKSRTKLMGVPEDIRLHPSIHFSEKTDSYIVVISAVLARTISGPTSCVRSAKCAERQPLLCLLPLPITVQLTLVFCGLCDNVSMPEL